MPASMMMAPAGFMLKVSGKSIAMVAGGPRPGSTPTTVPRNTPTKHHSRLEGASATEKPCRRPATMSTLEAQRACREREAQRQVEHQIEAEPGGQRHGRSSPGRPAVHDGDDEVGEEREARYEAQHFEQRDGDCECKPDGERAACAPPVDRIAAPRRPREAGRDEQEGQREDGDAVPQREETGAGSFRARILPLPGLRDDVDAEQRQRNARPQIARPSGPALHIVSSRRYFFLRAFL